MEYNKIMQLGIALLVVFTFNFLVALSVITVILLLVSLFIGESLATFDMTKVVLVISAVSAIVMSLLMLLIDWRGFWSIVNDSE